MKLIHIFPVVLRKKNNVLFTVSGRFYCQQWLANQLSSMPLSSHNHSVTLSFGTIMQQNNKSTGRFNIQLCFRENGYAILVNIAKN